MKIIYSILIFAFIAGCNAPADKSETTTSTQIKNEVIKKHAFLEDMYNDKYYPRFLVDKCKHVLLDLCAAIERENPKSLDDLYKLTHAATEEINALEKEFYENDSELETVARECLGMDFVFIATTYGFKDADVEELIAPRNW
ncbi:MAG TPA: DUF5713 family protein [Flavobacteriales bacterium]|nr:DUF5713 family protein [Flavobacteriales bacterium]